MLFSISRCHTKKHNGGSSSSHRRDLKTSEVSTNSGAKRPTGSTGPSIESFSSKTATSTKSTNASPAGTKKRQRSESGLPIPNFGTYPSSDEEDEADDAFLQSIFSKKHKSSQERTTKPTTAATNTNTNTPNSSSRPALKPLNTTSDTSTNLPAEPHPPPVHPVAPVRLESRTESTRASTSSSAASEQDFVDVARAEPPRRPQLKANAAFSNSSGGRSVVTNSSVPLLESTPVGSVDKAPAKQTAPTRQDMVRNKPQSESESVGETSIALSSIDNRNTASLDSEATARNYEGTTAPSGKFETQLSQSDLMPLVDTLFPTFDQNKATVKTFLVKMGQQLRRELYKEEKKLVKARLVQLVRGATPISNSGQSASTNGSPSAGPVVAQQTYAPRPVAKPAVIEQKEKDSLVGTTEHAKSTTHTNTLPPEVIELHSSLVTDPPKRASPRKPAGSPKKKNAAATKRRPTKANAAKNATNSKSRGRRKKALCALCTTCPCRKDLNFENQVETVQFARSQRAIERALIGRIQKTEKKCEQFEQQLEVERRRLRMHRRDVTKKKVQQKDRQNNDDKKVDYFLKDGPDFEETEIPRHPAGKKATKVLFPDTPCQQSLLYEFFSCGSKKVPPVADNEESKCTVVENTDEGASETPQGTNTLSQSSEVRDQEEVRPSISVTEYVQGPKHGDDSILVEASQGITRLALKPDSVLLGPDNRLSHLNGDAYKCPWDKIFSMDKEMSTSDGIEQLVSLFADSEANSYLSQNMAPDCSESCSQRSVHLSMLTPGRKALSTSIIEEVSSNEEVLRDLQGACPDWKENIAFAMNQTNKSDVAGALKQVQERRAKMNAVKAKILEAWRQQMAVLDVFENSLSASLNRPGESYPSTSAAQPMA